MVTNHSSVKHVADEDAKLRSALDVLITSADTEASRFRNGPVTVIVVRGEHAECLNAWYNEHFEVEKKG